MRKIYVIILVIILYSCFLSCEKEPLKHDNVMDENLTNSNGIYSFPFISDGSMSDVYANGATFNGSVNSDGGSVVIEKGICYNFSGNPSINFNKVDVGHGTGDYKCILDNLLPGYTYYVRAFATNASGTVYGHEINFSTPLY